MTRLCNRHCEFSVAQVAMLYDVAELSKMA